MKGKGGGILPKICLSGPSSNAVSNALQNWGARWPLPSRPPKTPAHGSSRCLSNSAPALGKSQLPAGQRGAAEQTAEVSDLFSSCPLPQPVPGVGQAQTRGFGVHHPLGGTPQHQKYPQPDLRHVSSFMSPSAGNEWLITMCHCC